MKVAILSLCKRQSSAPLLGLGLMPVGNATLLKYHIMLAQRAGAKKILCHIDAVPGELALHEQFARARGMEWLNIRNIAEISAHIGDDDEGLIIADGYYSDHALFDAFMMSDEPGILTADSDGVFQGFERLDINTLWAGLLKLPGTSFAGLSDVPDDWSLESVLLRQAVADKAPMQMVVQKDIDGFALSNAAISPINLSQSLVAAHKKTPIWQPFNRLSSWLARYMAPKIWQYKHSALIADIIAALLYLTAIVCGYTSFAAAAITSLFFGYLLLAVLNICARPLADIDRQKYRGYALAVSAFLVSAFLTMGFLQLITAQLFTLSVITAIGFFTAGQWSLLQFLRARLGPLKSYTALAFDPLVQTLWLLPSTILIIFPQIFFMLITFQLFSVILAIKGSDNVALTKS